MSYLRRLIAMSRGDERVAAPSDGGAGPSNAVLVLEQHEVVGPPASPVAAPRAPVAGPEVRDVGAPPRWASPPPKVTSGDPPGHEVHVAPRPPAPVAAPIAAPPARAPVQGPREAAAPAAARPPEPPSPGIQTLREVMHWIAQPPPVVVREDVSTPPSVVLSAPPPAPSTRLEAGRAPVTLARDAAPVIEHVEHGLSIGAIEVTIDAPPPAAPRPRPARPARRDTRLERRLPRGG